MKPNIKKQQIDLSQIQQSEQQTSIKKSSSRKVKFVDSSDSSSVVKFEELPKTQPIQSTVSNEDKDQILSKFNKANMLVVVRKRPLNKRELEINPATVIQISNGEQVTLLDTESIMNPIAGKTMPKHQHFFFDYAFDEDVSQEEIYMKTTKFLLQGVIDGYNATVLAYGATGCGKTYTMVGSPDNEGIMVRSLADLFMLKDKGEAEGKEIKISVSYVEIYNETILDLMVEKSQSTPLELYEDPSKSIIINGVNEIIVNNAEEVFKLLV